MVKILSPITKKPNVTHISSVDISWIIRQWKRSFSFDVAYLFKHVNQLDLYICNETGYKFYYPAIMGDSDFYEKLSQHEWYYMPWKWEHQKVYDIAFYDDYILEVGCGDGYFLEKMSRKALNTFGIELNKNAINIARKKGLRVFSELLEEHSLNMGGKYDIVCSFQVLEHIYDVDSFLRSSIKCLKDDGKLIISVPNNDSFISETDQILNMPPHHVGLWNEKSLTSISKLYNMKLKNIYFEPIQPYHMNFYKYTVCRKVIGKHYENRYFRKIYNELILKPFLSKYLEYVSKWIPGHTIIAVYEKNKL